MVQSPPKALEIILFLDNLKLMVHPPFDVVIPKNNNWQIDIDALAFQKFKVNDTAIKVPAAPHGYYVILKPLPPGEHKVLVYYVRTFPGDANNTPVITKSVATVTVEVAYGHCFNFITISFILFYSLHYKKLNEFVDRRPYWYLLVLIRVISY